MAHMTAVVLTAMFGDHDEPPRVPAVQSRRTEWHYYTDSDVEAPEPWRTHRVVGRYADPNLAAKVYKTCPPFDGDVIWIDANMEITSPSFVGEALDARRDGVAAWQHPRRDCIYDEAGAATGSERQGDKYDAFDLASQVASYRAEGYPAHAGLFACGTLAYDLDDLLVRTVGTRWLEECVRWSPQDQLSFPVVCWRLGVKPGVFPYRQLKRRRRMEEWPGYFENPWLRIWPHREKLS